MRYCARSAIDRILLLKEAREHVVIMRDVTICDAWLRTSAVFSPVYKYISVAKLKIISIYIRSINAWVLNIRRDWSKGRGRLDQPNHLSRKSGVDEGRG
jgi:hypothetical protein